MPKVDVPQEVGDNGTLPLNPVLEYVSVDRGTPLPEVRALPDSQWRPVEGLRGFGYSDQTLWFRIRLNGLKRIPETVFARINFAHHDTVEFGAFSGSRLLTNITTGDSKPFGTRPVDNTVYLLPVTRYGLNTLDLYVGITTPGSFIVPIDLITHDALDRHDDRELAWFAGYYGIIGLIFFNNLLVFFFVRDRTYLYYLSYLVSVGLLVFVLRGFAFQYWWPTTPVLNNYAVALTTPLTILLAVLFVIRFLDLRRSGDPLDFRVARALVFCFGGLMAAVFFIPYHLLLRVELFCSVLAIVFALYLGTKYSLRGFRAARLFAVAWFVYLVFVIVYIMDTLGLLQPTMITRNAFVIGSAVELTLLSIAFADRFNQEKKQRIDAQRQALEAQQRLNDQLDILVRSRTRELEQANQQLEQLSLSDALTGVANRRHFDQQAGKERLRAERTKTPLSVAIVDVDYFKRINDTYGHDVGDRCLIAIAEAIRSVACRPSDLVARYGGEEFAVLLPDCDLEGGRVVAERIRETIASLSVKAGHTNLQFTASIGLASCTPSAERTLEGLLKTADINLYNAKASGRNRVSAGPA